MGLGRLCGRCKQDQGIMDFELLLVPFKLLLAGLLPSLGAAQHCSVAAARGGLEGVGKKDGNRTSLEFSPMAAGKALALGAEEETVSSPAVKNIKPVRRHLDFALWTGDLGGGIRQSKL